MNKWRLCIILFCMLSIIQTGCLRKKENGEQEKVTYVVCTRNVVPEELGKLIDQEKKKTFHFTYTTGEFTQDQSHIYIDTTLIGVTKEHQRKGISYPYIILKSQFYEKDVIFH